VLGLAIAVVLLPTAATPQAPTVIKLATLVPDGSAWDKILREMGGQWSAATQGRVTLRIYPGGVAGDEPDIVRKMRIGQVQAAALTASGLSDIDPAFQVFGVPMFFDNYDELLAVLTKMEPVLEQRMEAKGFVLLNWGHGGWVHFFTKQPVKTVAEFKKTKMFVWAGDDRMVSLWKAQGYTPVPLAATDILTGLQTNMIEAYPCPPLAALSLQWYRSTPYMVELGLGPLVGGLVMTKAAWSKLSPADQAAVHTACKRAEARLAVEIPRQDTTSVIEMKKRGLTVTSVSPAAAAEWRAAATQFATALKGTISAADMMDLATRERDAYRARTGRATK
jgi:TRAP-type C4-dicarboxylate transport system substrate-binding protein